jgi:hypothetical protein
MKGMENRARTMPAMFPDQPFPARLLPDTGYKNREVGCMSDREEDCPCSFAVCACPHRRRSSITLAANLDLSTMMCPPLISFLDDAEGDIRSQR